MAPLSGIDPLNRQGMVLRADRSAGAGHGGLRGGLRGSRARVCYGSTGSRTLPVIAVWKTLAIDGTQVDPTMANRATKERSVGRGGFPISNSKESAMTKNLTRLAVVGFALLTLILLLAIQAGAYPEPGLVPRSWELDFTFKDPRRIAVKGVDGRTQWYWYVIYKVVNNTSEERLFVPEFTLATDHDSVGCTDDAFNLQAKHGVGL